MIQIQHLTSLAFVILASPIYKAVPTKTKLAAQTSTSPDSSPAPSYDNPNLHEDNIIAVALLLGLIILTLLIGIFVWVKDYFFQRNNLARSKKVMDVKHPARALHVITRNIQLNSSNSVSHDLAGHPVPVVNDKDVVKATAWSGFGGQE